MKRADQDLRRQNHCASHAPSGRARGTKAPIQESIADDMNCFPKTFPCQEREY
ncbi:hypothetical protein DPMN_011254 [Dreissena polymorpha]|uniref:Uncharacterized protein n=1 Tax=Dreissena polymorpha TaxID=45954 RepID=A0A9D4N081_DREPO|nr:hypothetical protein DPMN_011254 [Dreissena polymorpha]